MGGDPFSNRSLGSMDRFEADEKCPACV